MDTPNFIGGGVQGMVAAGRGEEGVRGVGNVVGGGGGVPFPAGAGVGAAAAAAAAQQLLSNMRRDSGEDSACFESGKRKSDMVKERNRVHARNARANKKQYMEELKERVENMHAKKAADERTKETAVREEEEQIARWAGTLKRVLDLRCEGVVDQAVWGEVLAEDFELSLPLTPYRTCDPADVEGGQRRILVGVEGMVSDTASLTEMCVTLAERCRQQAGLEVSTSDGGGESRPRVRLKCSVGSGDLVFSSDEGIMCVFNTTTVDACDYGSPLEVEQNGMLRAAFGEDGKMNELEMMFDGIAVHQQLQMAMGRIPSEGQARASVSNKVPIDEDQGGAGVPST